MSTAWNHFVRIPGKRAVCNFCKNIFSYNSTVSNLTKHLKTKHLSAFNKLGNSLNASNDDNESTSENLQLSDDELMSEESSSSESSQRRIKRQKKSKVQDCVTVYIPHHVSNQEQDDQPIAEEVEYQEVLKTRTLVWNYYERVPGKSAVARCLLCSNEYSYKGTKSNLNKHLRLMHKDAYRSISNSCKTINNTEYSVEYLQFSDDEQVTQESNSLGQNNIHQSDLENISVRPSKYEQEQNDTFIYVKYKPEQNEQIDKLCNTTTQENKLISVIEEQIAVPQEKVSHRIRSVSWNYYEKIPGKEGFARCILCSNELSYKTTVSNLKKHLKNKHKLSDIHLSNTNASVTKTENTVENPLLSDDEKMVNEEPSFSNPSPIHSQDFQDFSQNLNQVIIPQKYKHIQKNITTQLCKSDIVIQDCQPQSVIEDEKPQNIINTLMWDYFEKIPEQKECASCVLCKKVCCYRSTMTVLKKHLKHEHKSVYHSLFNKKSIRSTNTENIDGNLQLSGDEQALNSSQSSPIHSSKFPEILENLMQSRLHNHKKSKFQQVAIQLQKQLDKKLVDMIVYDFQPFSIVENQAFQDFVKALNPNYKLPDRKIISGTIIPEQFKECKTRIMKLIQKATHVCITIDSWSSLVMDSYFSVTAHFMLDLKRQSVMLHCGLYDLDTVDDLSISLKNIVQEYEIEDKITLAISNNVPSFKNAIENNEWQFLGCFVHKLNLVIDEALEIINIILNQVTRVVSHFKNNNLAKQALLKHQTYFGNDKQALQLLDCVPTRWNSIYYMLERFLKLRDVLQEVIKNLNVDLPILSIDTWDSIKQICMILQPFEEASRVMSNTKYLTASLGIVLVDGLKNVINLIKNKSIFSVAKTFLDKIDEGLEIYFPKSEIEDNMLLKVCTFMDPRFKILAFFDQSAGEDETCHLSRCAYLIKEHVLELLKIKIQEKQQDMPIHAVSADINTLTSENSEPISLWCKIDKNVASVATVDGITTKAKHELDMYLNEEVAQRDSCPIAWWSTRQIVYPNLAEIFMEHCHIVVTSIQCERIFSKAGIMMTEKRACLSRKYTPELVFLNYNKGHWG